MDNEHNIIKKGYLMCSIPSNAGFFRFKQTKRKKQWCKKYFALFRKSNCGIQRLEMFTNEKSYLKGDKLKKIIPLNNCFRIVQMSKKDQANVFEIHTKESIHYFSTESYFEMNNWLKNLQICAFNLENIEQSELKPIELNQTNANYENQSKLKEKIESDVIKNSSILSNQNKQQIPKNEENILYCSVDQQQQAKFRVTVGQTEAAIRCALQIYSSPKSNDPSIKHIADRESIKYYYLLFSSISINLIEDLTKSTICLYEWNFRNIRRYGCTNDSFSIEVGRKSATGAGLFMFYTKEGSTIFHLLAKHVNDLKNECINNNHLSIKELDLNRPIGTLINIPSNKYESSKIESTKYELNRFNLIKNNSSKYDSTANSPTSSNASSIKSSLNESSLSDSTQTNSGDFTSLNEHVQKGIENDQILGKKFNQISRNQKPALNIKKTNEGLNSLPVVQKRADIEENRIEKINHNNPFLIHFENEIKTDLNEINSKFNKPMNEINNLIKELHKNVPKQKIDEDEYNDVALGSNLVKQMNNKLSSCSVVNLIEDKKLGNFNKLNKSLPQIDKLGINANVDSKFSSKINSQINLQITSTNAKVSPKFNTEINTAINQIDKANYSNKITSEMVNNLPAEKPLILSHQPNVLIKPPRLSKMLNNDESNKINERDAQKEEPIFESRLDLFGYKKEENHYEIADDNENNENQIEKISSINLTTKNQTNSDQQNDSYLASKQIRSSESTNNLLPIDTYKMLVSTLNKIDEKSLNTLKEAIKRVLNENPSINNKTEDEFLKNFLLTNNNQETMVNYCVNDCEYAKIMKKKLIKKTIVEHF